MIVLIFHCLKPLNHLSKASAALTDEHKNSSLGYTEKSVLFHEIGSLWELQQHNETRGFPWPNAHQQPHGTEPPPGAMLAAGCLRQGPRPPSVHPGEAKEAQVCRKHTFVHLMALKWLHGDHHPLLSEETGVLYSLPNFQEAVCLSGSVIESQRLNFTWNNADTG